MAALTNERELKRQLEKSLEQIAQRFKSGHVSVGWPENSKYPADGEKPPEYIAAVAFKNEFGDPLNHQPPRPFFRRMIATEKPLMHKKVGALLKKFGVEQTLGMMGADIEGALKESINTLTTPKLAQYTIDKKGHDKPLIETGLMVSSVSHKVEAGK